MSTKKTKITHADWSRFITSLVNDEIKRLGLVIDDEFDNWDWEECEERAGTYYLNYYAATAEEFDAFAVRVDEIAGRRGWRVETFAGFGVFPEDTGDHKGRVLCYFHITPAAK